MGGGGGAAGPSALRKSTAPEGSATSTRPAGIAACAGGACGWARGGGAHGGGVQGSAAEVTGMGRDVRAKGGSGRACVGKGACSAIGDGALSW